MKAITKLGLIAALAGCMSFSAQAISITIDPAITAAVLTGNQTSQAQIDAAIAATLGTAVELYKQNVGGGESGSTAASYTTTFSNSPSDPADAFIEYVGTTGSPIVDGQAYLLVKDGNQDPAWYLFNLTALGWTGTDDITLENFWPGNGAISHVALYGTPGTDDDTPPPGVPDAGSTLALLGVALGGLGAIRRKVKA